MPHPTLLGGWFPRIRGAGMIMFKQGKILWVDNASGHFQPPLRSLRTVTKAFRELPEKAFHPEFRGFLDYLGQVITVRW